MQQIWEFQGAKSNNLFVVKDEYIYFGRSKKYELENNQKKVTDFDFKPKKNGYAIKIPVFSFEKFPNVNKELGPEMKSTGEAIRFIDNLKDPFFRKIYSERNLYLSR